MDATSAINNTIGFFSTACQFNTQAMKQTLKFWRISAGKDLFRLYMCLGKYTATLCRDIPGEIPWPHPYETVLDEPGYTLWRFFPDDGRDKAALASFIGAPPAGHTPHCVALDERRSLVKTVHNNTAGPVYVYGEKSATFDRRDESMDHYVDAILKCVKTIGKPTIGYGVCADGYPKLMAEALYPGTFAGLMLINSPVDFKVGGGPIQEAMRKYGIGHFENLVRMGNGLMDGKWIVLGFMSLSWEKRLEDDGINLLEMIINGDEDRLSKYRVFSRWYKYPLFHPVFLPGKRYNQVCGDLFWKNSLVRGEFVVHGRKVDLSDVLCPISVISGEKDQITLPEQAEAVCDCVGSSEKSVFRLPGGHFSFASENALAKRYPKPIEEITEAAGRWHFAN